MCVGGTVRKRPEVADGRSDLGVFDGFLDRSTGSPGFSLPTCRAQGSLLPSVLKGKRIQSYKKEAQKKHKDKGFSPIYFINNDASYSVQINNP